MGKYSLLVLDSHGSHLTTEFDRICAESEIISILMPTHSFRLLQPLDIGSFSTLKRVYGRIIGKQVHCGRNHTDKLDLLEAYPKDH